MILFYTHINPFSVGGIITSAKKWVEGAEDLGIEVLWCQAPKEKNGRFNFFQNKKLIKSNLNETSARIFLNQFSISSIIVHFVRFSLKFLSRIKEETDIPLLLN